MNRTPAQKTAVAAHVEAPDPAATGAAYERYADAARQLRSGDLVSANANITVASAIAAAGARNLLDHRAELDAAFKKVPWTLVERITEVGLAAQHADLLARLQEDAASAFADLYPRLTELRGILLDDLDLLVRRKLVPPKVVADLRKGDNTPQDYANDLRDAAQHYRENWEKVSHRTSVSPDELTEADALAAKVIARAGALHVAQAPKAGELTVAEMRRRMFTLLDRDYDEVRRLGAYLFWDRADGWQAYTPSLWSGRAKSTAAAEPAPTEAVTTTTEPPVVVGNKPGFQPG